MKKSQKPQLSENSTSDNKIFTHPAYGLITMTTCNGGNVTLFGSDIGHNQRISIEIEQAEHHRHLSNDWNHGTNTVCRFSMSYAQFASFITSNGNGNGTPVTLEIYRDENGNRLLAPAIEKIETKHDTHRQEIKNSCSKAIEQMKRQVAELKALIAGEPTKKQLQELHHSLKCTVDNMPSNMEFTVRQAEEALDLATNDAKIEVESYITMTAQRIGLEHINDLARLEKKD